MTLRMFFLFNVAAVLLLVGTGCSRSASDRPELGKVSGTILYEGKPFSNIVVIFTPEVGRQSAALTDANGHYELKYLHGVKGAKVGPHQVGFGLSEDATPAFPIPKRYAHGSSQPLAAVVEKGNNILDFNLTSK